MDETTRLTRSTPVLRSDDYQRAHRFYTTVLNFECVEEGGDPPRFGIFRRDQAFLFINAWNGAPPSKVGGWDAYIHVDGLDAFYRDVLERGADAKAPRVTAYGMREIEIMDPDGNVLCFGEDA